MRMVLAGLVALALTFCAASGAPDEAADAILKVHNQERAALGVPALAWDDKLASHAKAWAIQLAQTGRPEHSKPAARPGEGENLWMGTTGAFTPTEMAGGWAAEKAHFRNGVYPNVGTGPHVVGHFSQMIWRNTTAIGCATARSGQSDILVCRYSPAGNAIGEKVY